MFLQQTVDDEISRKIEYLERNNGQYLHKEWLIDQVVALHSAITGPDRNFALLTIREYITRRVEAVFRQIKDNEALAEDRQLSLPGYKRLQKWYICDVNGERVGVATIAMTDEQIDEKCDEMSRMAKGLREHIRELRHFQRTRKIKPVK